MNLEGIPHYELEGRILFHKARHRRLAMTAQPEPYRFDPYQSTRKKPGEGAPAYKMHWRDSFCVYVRKYKRSRKDNIVDGKDFYATPEHERCQYCERNFQNS